MLILGLGILIYHPSGNLQITCLDIGQGDCISIQLPQGQNFLIDPQIPYDIAAASQADIACGVLEIGPGIGPLTQQLARRAGKVVSVELDRRLYPVLRETMADFDNFTLLEGDAWVDSRLLLHGLDGQDVYLVTLDDAPVGITFGEEILTFIRDHWGEDVDPAELQAIVAAHAPGSQL